MISLLNCLLINSLTKKLTHENLLSFHEIFQFITVKIFLKFFFLLTVCHTHREKSSFLLLIFLPFLLPHLNHQRIYIWQSFFSTTTQTSTLTGYFFFSSIYFFSGHWSFCCCTYVYDNPSIYFYYLLLSFSHCSQMN